MHREDQSGNGTEVWADCASEWHHCAGRQHVSAILRPQRHRRLDLWAERINGGEEEIDRRHPVKPTQQQTDR